MSDSEREIGRPDGGSAYGIDLAALAGWMRDNDIPVDGDLVAERIGVGQSNLTFRLSDGSNRWVLRRPPLGELVASAHDVVREHRIMAALQDSAVPVPRMLGVCTDPRVCDGPLVIEELVDAATIDTTDGLAQVPVQARTRVSVEMARTLAAIHDLDLAKTGLTDLASHSPYAERQLRRWSRQWAAVRTRDSPLVDAVGAKLRDRMPVQQQTVLVHGDFHLRNILIDPATGEIRAVVDWELATLGDPLADMGTMLAYWPQASDAPLPIFDATRAEGFLDHSALLKEYAAASGRDTDDVAYWHALGLWKIAVIAEGVLRRALDHPENASSIGPPSTAQIDALLVHADSLLS